jgi:hypothetical protein
MVGYDSILFFPIGRVGERQYAPNLLLWAVPSDEA